MKAQRGSRGIALLFL